MLNISNHIERRDLCVHENNNVFHHSDVVTNVSLSTRLSSSLNGNGTRFRHARINSSILATHTGFM